MTVGARLDESAWGLLQEALELYRDDGRAIGHLRHHLARLEAPLRIAVAGPWRSGKSTALNSIIGEELAPIEVEDGGQLLTWYEDGPAPRATAYSAASPPEDLPLTRTAIGLGVDLVGWRAGEITDIVVQWPTRALRQATLIDAPAIVPAGEDGTPSNFERVRQDADAVLYLTRDGRDTDLRFLEADQESAVGRAAPVHVILVLSRADEVGGGRIDALVAAKQLARRQRRDPRVNALCVNVVALGGLVALAGRVLSESDYATLATLAGVPRAELDAFLISTDRFVGGELPVRLDAETRRALLDRLGLFGVRLAATLIRTGSDSRAKLSAELIRRSGLTELRESIGRCFIDRRDVLKARSALAALESLLRTERRPGTVELLARVEQVLTGAHDFRELRLLAALEDARFGFDAELAAEARRLVGGDGVGLAARLGVEHDATAARLWELGGEALWRWQDRAEDPLLRLEQRRAAKVVVRSCEGMLAELAQGGR
jgi:hypothetical protein